MIRKGNDYDTVTGFGQSDFKPLPKGGYICRIIKAEEMIGSNGTHLLHIAFDISEGEYKDYFSNLYQSRKKSNTDPTKEIKWPFEGQSWIPLNDYEDKTKTSRKFKGFCTAVEDSGTEIWNLDGTFALDRLKNADVGIVFQNVENEFNDKISWKAQPWGFRSIEAIATDNYFIPDDKPLSTTYGTGFSETSISADSFNAAEDDIPF